jgi:hypothetical protein
VNRRSIEPCLLARCLIRAAAWMVPFRSRADWQREWMGELHYAQQTLWEKGREMAAGSRLVGFALGAFQDAAWYRTHTWSREHFKWTVARGTKSASFCLFAIGLILTVITVTSGSLPRTRAALLRLPYTDPDRIVTVAQGDATLAVRSGIRDEWVRWWRTDSHLIEGAATYFWSEKTVDRRGTQVATVSSVFFPLLGAQTEDKRRFASNSFENCGNCVVLSNDFWRKAYHGKAPASVVMNGTRFRVIAVLNKEFWFLTRRIGVWEIGRGAANRNAKTGVVIRLRPDVTDAQARAELVSIVQAQGVNPWSSLYFFTEHTGSRSVLVLRARAYPRRRNDFASRSREFRAMECARIRPCAVFLLQDRIAARRCAASRFGIYASAFDHDVGGY